MAARPTLSVFVVNRNHGHLLERKVRAILGQSWAPDELLLVDDASTDGSAETMAALARGDRRVKVKAHRRPRGPAACAAEALDHVTGEYVHACTTDDDMRPGFLETCMAMLVRFPRAGICTPIHATMDPATGDVAPSDMAWSPHARYFKPDELERIIDGGHLAGHVVVRRDALLAAGGYLPDLRWSADWFAHLVVAYRTGCCFVPEVLEPVRHEPGGYTDGRNRLADAADVVVRVLQRLNSPAYADVLPRFQGGQNLRCVGPEFAAALLRHPELATPTNVRLGRRALIETLDSDVQIEVALGQVPKRPSPLVPLRPRTFRVLVVADPAAAADGLRKACAEAYGEAGDAVVEVLEPSPDQAAETADALRVADLVVGSPAIARLARSLGVPALVDPSASELQEVKAALTTAEGGPALRWPGQGGPRWLVTGDRWEAGLAAYASRRSGAGAFVVRVGPGLKAATEAAVRAWLERERMAPEWRSEVTVLEAAGAPDPGTFRTATTWVDDGLPRHRVVAKALGLDVVS